MKKHEDHVRVLEALIYNQETLVSLKNAKIEELEDSKQQLQYHFSKLQDNQLFFDVSFRQCLRREFRLHSTEPVNSALLAKLLRVWKFDG